MSLLLLFLLVLPLSICESSKEIVQDDLEETIYKSEKLEEIEDKVEELENKLEAKNVELDNLQNQLKEVKMELGYSQKKAADLENKFAEMENKMEEVMLSTQKKNQNQDVASLKSEVRAEVKKEVDKVLPDAVEQGLRDLPYEMVCAYKYKWDTLGAVSYDNITLEFNNSNRPGGADGTMNIETGVFTSVTSGYYIITYSATVNVRPGEYTQISLYHNGVQLEEGRFNTDMHVGDSGNYNYIFDQGSRTVVSTLLVFDY